MDPGQAPWEKLSSCFLHCRVKGLKEYVHHPPHCTDEETEALGGAGLAHIAIQRQSLAKTGPAINVGQVVSCARAAG